MDKKRKTDKDINTVLREQEQLSKGTARKKFKIPVLTLILLVFTIYLVLGVIVNSAKIYSLNSQIMKLNKINKIATKKNQYLREELEKYTSNSGVEALARNRLQFSKEDETLVIIKDNQNKNNFE